MSGGLGGKAATAAAVVGFAAVTNAHGHHGVGAALAAASGPMPHAARVAIRYAGDQLGKPYLLGGTGPGVFDCSGLVMEAYAHAGVTIPRTSQAQWAGLPHVPASQRKAGDIEFVVGSDGTWQAPGHEVLLISRNKAIEAYSDGTTVRVIDLKDPPPGDQNVVGFARPTGGRS